MGNANIIQSSAAMNQTQDSLNLGQDSSSSANKLGSNPILIVSDRNLLRAAIFLE